jgi:hypothetical protein
MGYCEITQIILAVIFYFYVKTAVSIKILYIFIL